MWFRSSLEKCRGKNRERRTAIRFFRPELEILGQRILPSANYFTGADGTPYWSDPANWSTAHTPNSGDQIYVGQVASEDDISNVTVADWLSNGSAQIAIDPGNSVTSQNNINIGGPLVMNTAPSGSTIQAANDVYINSGGSVNATGSAGPMSSANVIAKNVIVESGATINVNGGPTATPDLSITGDLNDYGTVNLGTPNNPNTQAVMPITGAVVVETGGSANLYQGSTLSCCGGLSIDGTSTMNGTVTMMGATINGNVTINSNGVLDSQGGETQPFTTTGYEYGDAIYGNVVNSGLIEVDPTQADHTLYVTGYFTQQSSGTLSLSVDPNGDTQLSVGETATFGGTLEVSIANGAILEPYSESWFQIFADANGGYTAFVNNFAHIVFPSAYANWVAYLTTNNNGVPTYAVEDLQ